jgi:ribosomal-protein-alanine N-acetyltransferase
METKLPIIKTKNIILRELKRGDFVDLFRIGSNPKMCEFLNWGPYKNINEALYTLDEIYLKRPLENLPIGYAIELDGVMRGLIEYHTYDEYQNSIEIGYFLEFDYWNKGIMTKALKKAIWVAFNHLNVDKIIISTLNENERCLNLIKKFKFKYEREEMLEIDDGIFKLGSYFSIYKEEYGG